jgi:CRP-like cAMP-binding protein
MIEPLLNKRYLDVAYQYFNKYVFIDKEQFEQIAPFFEIRSFAKKEKLLDIGEQENFMNLVITGLVRKYMVVRKKEITTQLSSEGHIINSEISYYLRKPSNFIIEAIEPSVVISVTHSNMNAMFEKMPQTERFGRIVITDMFIRKDHQYVDKLEKTTRERFLEFVNNHPDMLQRVPQKYLASYLNIKPETFSRLKHLVKQTTK